MEFSPFVDNLVAVGTAQYFGIVGNGRQHVYEMLPAGDWLRYVEAVPAVKVE